MILSAAGGYQTPVAVSDAPKVDQVNPVKEKSQEEVSKDIATQMSTEQYVRQYFADVPVMIQIARCETHFRQLDPKGNVHRGVIDNRDVGVMQINEHYHLDEAETAGYNIYTLEGNTAFARALYEKEGTVPWNSSKACWGKTVSATVAVK